MTRFAFSSAAYLRNRDGEVMLVLHKRFGLWVPVGGELEPGETPLQAIVREVREETSIDLTQHHPAAAARFAAFEHNGAPVGFIGYEQHDAASKGIHGTFSFLFDVDDDEPVLCDEHDGIAWVKGWVEEIAHKYPMPPNVQMYLTRIFHGVNRRR